MIRVQALLGRGLSRLRGGKTLWDVNLSFDEIASKLRRRRNMLIVTRSELDRETCDASSRAFDVLEAKSEGEREESVSRG